MNTLPVWNLAPLLIVALSACSSGSPSHPEDVGEVSAAITSVPSNVACIDIQVANGERTVDRQFPVSPGQASANLSLTGLPLGSDVLSGLAYAVTCSSVTPTTSADWATDPLAVTLSPGKTGNVSLQFHAAGSLTIGVGFDDAGVAPWLVASPSSYSFNGGACPTPIPAQSFTLTNQGSSASKALTIKFSNVVGHGTYSVVSGTDQCSGKALATGGSCTVSVQVTGACGNQSGTLTFSDGTSSVAVPLTGSNG